MPRTSDTERLSLALAAAKLGDWSWDAASDLVTFSERAAAIFQIPPGPHMTWTVMRELLHPDDADRARIGVERALETQTDYDIEYRLVNGTGERWVRASGRGVYDAAGGVVGMLGVVQDISDNVAVRETLRRQADSLRASEERYRAFIDNSSEGIWRLEFDPPIDTTLPAGQQVELAYRHGRFAECNAVMARMYGLASSEELVGKTLDFMLPSSDPDAKAYVASIIEAGYRASDVESKEQDAHGRVKYFSNSMTGIVIEGMLHRVWGTQRDIADRKRAEEAQAYLAAVVGSADDAIVSKDLDGIIQSWNTGAERIFGYTAAEILGKPVRTLIPADRQSEEDAILAQLRRGERVDHFETVRVRKDGTPIDVSLTISPVRDSDGRIIGASKIARDITAQKQASAELSAQGVVPDHAQQYR
jgi:PAS domain S-box-containing protein